MTPEAHRFSIILLVCFVVARFSIARFLHATRRRILDILREQYPDVLSAFRYERTNEEGEKKPHLWNTVMFRPGRLPQDAALKSNMRLHQVLAVGQALLFFVVLAIAVVIAAKNPMPR